METRVFPVLNDPFIKGVPFDFMLKYEVQLRRNHSVNLECLARNGLRLSEIWAAVNGVPRSSLQASNSGMMRKRIMEMVWEHEKLEIPRSLSA